MSDNLSIMQKDKKQTVKTMLEDNELSAFDVKNVKAVPFQQDIEHTKDKVEFLSLLLSDTVSTKELELTKADKLRLQSIRNRGMSHLLLNETKWTGDSKEMKLVKFRVEKLEQKLDEIRDKNLSADVAEELLIAYKLTIDACNAYIEDPDKNKNNRRYFSVRDTRNMLRNEMNILNIAWTQDKEGLEQKTVAEVIGLSKQKAVKPAFKKKKSAPPAQEMSTEAEHLAKLFDKKTTVDKLFKAAGDKKKFADEVTNLIRRIRSMPEGSLSFGTLLYEGKNLRFIHSKDNVLSIVEGTKEFPLGNASLLCDKLELDMAVHSERYKKEDVRELMAGRLVKYGPEDEGFVPKKEKALSMGDLETKRQMYVSFLEKQTKIAKPRFNNLSYEDLKAFALMVAKRIGKASQMADATAEIKTVVEQSEKFGLINSSLTSEELAYRQQEGIKNNVVIHKKEEAAQDLKENQKWDQDEQEILNTFADLIFNQETCPNVI